MEFIGGADIDRMGSEIPRVMTRYPVDLEVTWYLPKGNLSFRPKATTARILDLSLAGAMVETARDKRITVGSEATFELQGRRGRAQIRHVAHPLERPDHLHLGVAFTRLDDELRDAIHRFVERQRSTRRTQQPEHR